MTKKGLQGVASGIFIATAFLAYMYFFQTIEVESHEEHPQVPQLELSSEEMMEILSNQGFVVLDEEEYNSLLNAKDSPQTETSYPNEIIYSSILIITSGMSSTTVAEQLEHNKIIDDAYSFIDYLESQELTRRIEVGEFELNSTMTFSEIAEIITE